MNATDQSDEIYGMLSFVMLKVKDPAGSRKWYEGALGFRHIFSIPRPGGSPVLVHLRWTKYADLLLQLQSPRDMDLAKGNGLTLNYSVTTGTIDELVERARRYGASLVSEPKNQPWNARDFSLADPEGFVLTFTKGPIDEELGMDNIVRRSSGR